MSEPIKNTPHVVAQEMARTRLGEQLLRIREQIVASGEPLLSWKEIERELAARFGLAALDALHVAAALSVGAEELITTEKHSKPLHRATGILVRSIQAD